MKEILKTIKESMIRLEKILIDLKNQLANKTNVGHSHDISNISGLEYRLNIKSNRVHTHIPADINNLDTLIRKYLHPEFSLDVLPNCHTAMVKIQLVSANGYCMDHVTLHIRHREMFTTKWLQEHVIAFSDQKEYRIVLSNLKSSIGYHIELTIRDTYNPLLRIELNDVFKTLEEYP